MSDNYNAFIISINNVLTCGYPNLSNVLSVCRIFAKKWIKNKLHIISSIYIHKL